MIGLDMEMTGANPEKHAICSIGAVDFKNPKRTFYAECRVPDDALIDPEAMEINGFTEEQVRDPKKKSVLECVKDFLKWCEECDNITLVGQCVFFDRAFLKAVMDRHGLPWHFRYRVLDLHSAAWTFMVLRGETPPVKEKVSALNLDASAKYAGLTEEPKPHNALNGAKFSSEAFSRIVFGKPLLDEFKKFPLPENLRR